jgi:hypothetical protein
MNWVNYIPLATSALSVVFFIILYKHWRYQHHTRYIFWWMLGIFFYGAGTFTECINTLAGYNPINFKAWYILGALLGGAPLAQGTVYLLLKKRTADILSAILITVLVITSVLVMVSPLQPVNEPDVRLSGELLEWSFIRLITPFINTYAFIFLVGGAIYSAVLYNRSMAHKSRVTGNVLIALGGLLPGIGGSFSRFGFIEVLYITEFVGLCLIYGGYEIIRSGDERSMHPTQII